MLVILQVMLVSYGAQAQAGAAAGPQPVGRLAVERHPRQEGAVGVAGVDLRHDLGRRELTLLVEQGAATAFVEPDRFTQTALVTSSRAIASP